ncbi:Dynein regulatory complex subunit 6 [Geranomyces variabilis]|uniref:Dynein regulatory complex subunit 6 n=1 Tax=Geranomyces variabilis TaxID=109894 RepID=A0AAD5XMR4_9FUNG|nr:Dynein regulatory complex subunit 6 [Geranomyces variabilis]
MDLPPEIFNLVCSYLPFGDRVRCTGICRAWRAALCADMRRWAELDFSSFGPRATNQSLLAWTAKAGPHLRRLALRRTPRITTAAFTGLAKRNSQYLQYLQLTENTKVSATALEKFLKGTAALVRLDLSSTSVNEAGLASVLQYSRVLTHLKLDQCGNITGEAFRAYAKTESNSRRLALLDVSVAGTHYRSESVALLARSCPNLRRVDFTGCQQVSQSALVGLKDALTLVSLRITGIDTSHRASLSINDSLLLMAGECTAIEVFSLTKCPTLTETGFSYVALAWTSLRELNVSQCQQLNDAALRLLSLSCSGLHALLVSTCPRIGDGGIVSIIKNLRALSYLDISNNANVTDLSVKTITQLGASLTKLDISNCGKITGWAVRNLVNKPGANFELLRMNNCTRVHQDTVLTLRAEMRKTKISAILD